MKLSNLNEAIKRRLRSGLNTAALAALALLGQVSWAVNTPAGTVLQAQALASYQPAGWAQKEKVLSNVVQVQIAPVEAIVLSGDSWVARAPGTHIAVPYSLANKGNVASDLQAVVLNASAAGCSGYSDTTDVANLRVVVDANGNGIADPAEGAANRFSLAAGETVSLLVLGDVPMSSVGGACLELTLKTALQSLVRTQATYVSIADNPVVQIRKTATYSQALTAGGSDTARYELTATNIGTRSATPVANAAATSDSLGGQAITVNGTPMTVVLLRDAIPAGAQFKAGSLAVSHANAYKLYRIASDAPFAYRLGDPGAGAVEVAAAYPFEVAVGQSVGLSFEVSALISAGRTLDNVAQIHFGNVSGVSATSVIQSNEAQVPIAGQRLALAHQVVGSKINLVSGMPDGTVTYTLALRVRNDGDVPLYNLQLPHLLAGGNAFGNPAGANVPGNGQYTVVAGSVQVVDRINSATVVAVNPQFSGQGDQTGLLANGGKGSVLPVGGDFTLQYQVQVNVTGRAGITIYSQVVGQGSLHSYSSTVDAQDTSTNGSDPDPDGDLNPTNNSIPTPITFPDVAAYRNLAAGLKISKTAASPVRITQGVYDLTYTLQVSNNSDVSIPFVRVVDNLNCTFSALDSGLNIASWSWVSKPVAKYGVLPVAAGYSGDATCDVPQQTSGDVTDMPHDPRTIINDASKTLAPGAMEEYTYTVRVTQKNPGLRSQVSNKAWLAAMADNDLVNPSVIVAATSVAVSLLVDPQGYVYDSITRQPIPGAMLTLKRVSCDGGSANPITAAEIFDSDTYTFNGDGTVSMVTGNDGQYQFFWKVPPIADICTYSLSVMPPATHIASGLLPPQNGVYGGCGFVVPESGIPAGTEATQWFNQFRTGYRAGGSPADCPVLHDHIPLDPANLGSALLLSKQANKHQAEMGDFVDYQLTLSNRSGTGVNQITLADIMPPGFAYVPGSSSLGNQRLADPVISADNASHRASLRYALGSVTIPDKDKIVLRYRLRIGVGAISESDAINSARASAKSTAAPMILQSNLAQARVRVSGGVFSNQGFAIGKVWADCNRNGVQDGPDEPGLPGVRLYMEDGTSVITDQFGRWSLYGLKPMTHALRVDRSTLPTGVALSVLDNRQAGMADSRFLDIKNGELVRADFAVDGCSVPALMPEIERRQQAFAKATDMQLQALVSARLPTESRVASVGDVRGLPASGVVAGGGSAGMAAPGMAQPIPDSQTLPLIDLPRGMAQGVGNIGGAAPIAPGGLSPGNTGLLPKPVPGPEGNSSPATKFPGAPGMSESLFGRLAKLSAQPLEEVIEKLPVRAAFIELKDGDTVADNQVNVRVTGPQQSNLRLRVNGVVIPDTRVGKKSVVTATGLVAYEYIGVALQAGVNTLQLDALDEFGNVRQQVDVRVRAPGGLARFLLEPQGRLSADPLRPATIRLRLIDAAGVPITAHTAVTLDAQGARWLNEDLNPAEPGVQIFVDGGETTLQLQPPAQQSVVTVRLVSGALEQKENLSFLPALTPLQGIGVVEGLFDLSKSGRLSLSQPQASNAFEQELGGMSGTHGDVRASGRGAFYLKGAIKGEYLLTAAYDSSKVQRDRLFRDIRPDEFYPVYGDGSVRGFDAQSSGRLYVRIDKNRSFLLLGDFNTTSSPEVRQVSQYSRALTGAQHRYQDDNVRATSFYAETNATQQVEEFPATGLSFYNLGNNTGDIRPGSEKVEVLVRDRQQPQIVLASRGLTNLVDYSFEPLTRRLTLAQPLASYDADLNPQSIRVTYELEQGGPTYKVMGTDVQVKAGDHAQLGVVAVRDENPQNRRDLRAATALVRLSDHAALSAEIARTDTDLKGTGNAARVSVRHEAGALKAEAQYQKTGASFDNLSATSGAGRTEAVARADYALDESTRVRTEAYFSRDDNASSTGAVTTAVAGERSNVGVAVAHKLTENLVGELSLRTGNSTGNTAGGFDYGQVGSSPGSSASSSLGSLGGVATTNVQSPSVSTTARARLTARPEFLPRLQLFGEVEQDLKENDRHAIRLGGNYALTEKTRLYAQYALQSNLADVASINGQNLRNTTVAGIDSSYMEGGRLYNEYRSAASAAPQNATGLRNTYKLNEQWRLSGGIEHVQTVGANPVGDKVSNTTQSSTSATAVALGIDWASGAWRVSSALERRNASTSDASLYSLAGAWRLDNDLSLLARVISTDTEDHTNGGYNRLLRHQLGLAWRPAHADAWNVLGRYEYRLQDVGAGNADSADPFATTGVANTSLGRTATHILSTHANWQMARGQQLSMRWAGKITTLEDTVAASRYWANLAHARYTRDLNSEWDIGLQAGYLWGQGGASQSTLGTEVGYQAMPGLWLSAGYNVLGLRDPDLTGSNYTSRGIYFRLRWKFDEATLQFGRVADPAAATATGQAQ